ncbi:MAG TPA: hypothetical protein VFU21_17885 [Kofleriaceae bacterium]|nr:hypothetical protein [Kofleriaceae bacterium]
MTASDSSVGDPSLYGVMDRLMASFTSEELVPEVSRAREQYETRRGLVREDEELWELWSQIFVEWFALEWTGGDDARPPAARMLERTRDGKDAATLRAWLRSQRALCEILAMRPGAVRVRDLLRGGLFEVTEKRSLHGVDTGDIAEVRLIGFDGQVRFGRTFLFHPSGTRAVIEEQVAQRLAQGSSPEEILDHCAQLRLRTERYRHVDPVRVYRAAGDELTDA